MKSVSTTQKFRALHLFTHTLAIGGLVWAFSTGAWGWLALSFCAFLFVGVFGVNIALHRFFSHHSFEVSDRGHLFLLVCSFLPMLGSPAMWGTVHLYHHRHSDEDTDPHSPKNAGKFGSWFTLWPSFKIPLSLFRFFARDKSALWVHRNYFKLIVAYASVLALIHPLLLVFLFAVPAVGCFHGAAAIAVIPHLRNFGGYRNHETKDNSHNHVLAWILSLGEGWHNNHHARPRSYRQGEKWWEIDPSAWIIKHLLATKVRS